MRGTLFTFLLFLNAIRVLAAAEWTLVKHEGRDYVPLDNVGKFYKLGPVKETGNNFILRNGPRSLHGQSGSPEFYINNLKFILSYPIASENGKLIVSRMDLTKLIEPVLRPNRIRNAEKVDTVVLDAGHGGHDNGASSLLGCEKNYALDVALRARDLLRGAGFKVYMTRANDTFIPLEERPRFANRFSNALFISIHFNSSGPAATGIETYTLAPRGVPSMMADGPAISDFVPCPGNFNDPANIALACAAHAALVYNCGMYDRGIKRARFVVIRDVTIPGVLVEGGFLSNPTDAQKIAMLEYRQRMAVSILQAVQNYRNAVGSAPPLPLSTSAGGSTSDMEGKPHNVPIVVTPSTSTH